MMTATGEILSPGRTLLKPSQYWLLSALAALGVLLVALNAALYFANRSTQSLVSARAQYLQQSQPIGSLYQEIAKTLAKLAVDNHDEQLKALLAGEGFTISQAPAKP
jgi:hypothetical protein